MKMIIRSNCHSMNCSWNNSGYYSQAVSEYRSRSVSAFICSQNGSYNQTVRGVWSSCWEANFIWSYCD